MSLIFLILTSIARFGPPIRLKSKVPGSQSQQRLELVLRPRIEKRCLGCSFFLFPRPGRRDYTHSEISAARFSVLRPRPVFSLVQSMDRGSSAGVSVAPRRRGDRRRRSCPRGAFHSLAETPGPRPASSPRNRAEGRGTLATVASTKISSCTCLGRSRRLSHRVGRFLGELACGAKRFRPRGRIPLIDATRPNTTPGLL